MKTFSQSSVSDWTFRDRPTLNFLLRCLCAGTDSQTIHQIQTLAQSEIDWQFLAQIAKDHRVVPLLYNRLNTACPNTVPAPLLQELRAYCKDIAICNLSTTAELRRLLLLMKAQGIDALPYKGPVLTQMLYENLELRQFGDLDIVIQPEDMRSVETLLIAEGYRPYFGKKTTAELTAYMKAKTEHTYDFYHDSKNILIEVHWRFWPPFFSLVNPKEIWHRRESAKIGGAEVSNLAIEDYLVILCMHGSRHMWQRLAWLCDIAVLTHKYPALDWERAIATAEQWGSKRMLYLGLYLAHYWLEARLPKSILEQISTESAVTELAKRVDNQLFKLSETYRPFMETTRYQIQARERWSDKAVYAQSFIYWLSRGCPSDTHTA
jgi:hypothetical protein